LQKTFVVAGKKLTAARQWRRDLESAAVESPCVLIAALVVAEEAQSQQRKRQDDYTEQSY